MADCSQPVRKGNATCDAHWMEAQRRGNALLDRAIGLGRWTPEPVLADMPQDLTYYAYSDDGRVVGSLLHFRLLDGQQWWSLTHGGSDTGAGTLADDLEAAARIIRWHDEPGPRYISPLYSAPERSVRRPRLLWSASRATGPKCLLGVRKSPVRPWPANHLPRCAGLAVAQAPCTWASGLADAGTAWRFGGDQPAAPASAFLPFGSPRWR